MTSVEIAVHTCFLVFNFDRYFMCVPPNYPEDNLSDKLCSMSEGELNFFGPSEPGRSGESSSSCVGDIQRVITCHSEASKIGQQIADEEIRFANGLAGPSSNDPSCNTSPLSALLQTTNGNNSPLASLNTPSQSPIGASSSGVDLIGDFAVSATIGEEEQSSMMSDTSNIVNYSTPSPSISSGDLLHLFGC